MYTYKIVVSNDTTGEEIYRNSTSIAEVAVKCIFSAEALIKDHTVNDAIYNDTLDDLDHDCHMSAMDGCPTCYKLNENYG